jgi:prepilin-type processing-associated H-X9-DG protein
VTLTGPPGWSDYAMCAGHNYGQTTPDGWTGAGYRAFYPGQNRYLNSAQTDMYEIWSGWQYVMTFLRIRDGTSNTFLFGEKHVPLGTTDGPVYNGDYQSQYIKFAGRWGTQDPVTRRWTNEFPLVTEPRFAGVNYNVVFAAWIHPGVGQFAMCDGSVRAIPASVSIDVLYRLANRDDGEVVGDF